jgi:hypothetical protein
MPRIGDMPVGLNGRLTNPAAVQGPAAQSLSAAAATADNDGVLFHAVRPTSSD